MIVEMEDGVAKTNENIMLIKSSWKRRAQNRSKGEHHAPIPLKKKHSTKCVDEVSSKVTKGKELKYSSNEEEIVPETPEVEAAMQLHLTR